MGGQAQQGAQTTLGPLRVLIGLKNGRWAKTSKDHRTPEGDKLLSIDGYATIAERDVTRGEYDVGLIYEFKDPNDYLRLGVFSNDLKYIRPWLVKEVKRRGE